MKESIFQYRCFQLLSGIVGIYVTYLSLGIIQQHLIKQPYQNIETGQMETFTSPIHFVLVPHGVTCLIGAIYNKFSIPKSERVKIPAKNGFICGLIVLISGLTFNYAIKWTNYPIVTIGKSCNIISVILVGTCCSRVTDARLKLSPKKIIIGVVASIGIIIFKYFDPEQKTGQQKKTQIMGLVLLLISLLADGFLPDFQAEIKVNFKPRPTEMMVEVNKCIFLLALIYSCFVLQVADSITFSIEHPLFAIHLLVLSLLGCAGQFFVYRMIKQFKQHFVPFVITTRKIFTVAVSIVYYGHQTNIPQISGIILVLLVVIYEFVSELMEERALDKKQNKRLQDKEKREEEPTNIQLEQESNQQIIKHQKLVSCPKEIMNSNQQKSKKSTINNRSD